MREEKENCYKCKYWITSERIQEKYGEGEGRCQQSDEVFFCDRRICMMFEEKDGGDAE